MRYERAEPALRTDPSVRPVSAFWRAASMLALRTAHAWAGVLSALALALLASGTAVAAHESRQAGTTGAFPSLGIAASWMRDQQVDTVADGVVSAGAQAARIDVTWSSVERARGEYSWAHTDRVVSALADHGLALLGVCAYSPAWANGGRQEVTNPPLGPYYDDYARFCAAAAERYPQIQAWEVWNEPNLAQFWRGPNASDYAALLRTTYQALKTVDPRLIVVSAGLAPYGAYGQADAGGVNPRTFLQQMYAAGARGHMDAVGYHPYGNPLTFAYRELGDTRPSIRSIMLRNGDGGKLIWATEVGQGLQPYQPWGAASEDQQARDVPWIVGNLLSRPYVGPLLWFTYADYVERGYGLVRSDASPRPALAAFRDLSRLQRPETSPVMQ